MLLDELKDVEKALIQTNQWLDENIDMKSISKRLLPNFYVKQVSSSILRLENFQYQPYRELRFGPHPPSSSSTRWQSSSLLSRQPFSKGQPTNAQSQLHETVIGEARVADTKMLAHEGVTKWMKKCWELPNVEGQFRADDKKRSLMRTETSKPMISARKLFLEDPQRYWRRIDRLEFQSFRTGKEIFHFSSHSQESDVSVFKSTIGLNFSPAPGAVDEICEKFRDQIQQDLKVIQGIIASLQRFVNIEFSKDTYSIIVLDPERDWVVRIIPITAENLCLLRDLLQSGLDTLFAHLDSARFKWSTIKEAMIDIGEAASLVLRHMGLHLTDHSTTADDYKQCTFHLSLVSCTTSILFLGLVSYIKSHIGNFDETLFQRVINVFIIETGHGPIYFRRHQLACLSSFVKASVWIFMLAPLEPKVDGMYLSTHLIDFVDLWGPVQLPFVDEESDCVSEIVVSGGSIRKSRYDPPGEVLPEETTCHWYSWTDPELPDDQDVITEPFSTTQLLLIGAGSHLSNPSTFVAFHADRICRCKYKYSINVRNLSLIRSLPITKSTLSPHRFRWRK